MVEHLKVLSSPLPYGRAPKGDGGQSSLLPHPYQSSPVGPLPDGRAPKGPLQLTYLVGGLMVEHLKVMAASRACFRIQLTYLVGGLWSSASGPYQSSPLKGDGGDGGPYGRARNPSPYE